MSYPKSRYAQQRAIWYSMRKRELDDQLEYLEKNNLLAEFKASGYKYMSGFIKAHKRGKRAK